MDVDGLEVVLADRGQRQLAVVDHGHLGAVGGMDGVGHAAVDPHRLDIGQIAHAERREIGRRQRAELFDDGHLYSPFGSPAGPRKANAQRALSVSTSMVGAPGRLALGALLISMVRTRVSGIGRLRSMCSRPLSRSAPITSMPSTRTKLRWNWRAAMPRCR